MLRLYVRFYLAMLASLAVFGLAAAALWHLAGGPMERELARAGVEHLRLPLATKNPLQIRRNAAALVDIIRRYKIDEHITDRDMEAFKKSLQLEFD